MVLVEKRPGPLNRRVAESGKRRAEEGSIQPSPAQQASGRRWPQKDWRRPGKKKSGKIEDFVGRGVLGGLRSPARAKRKGTSYVVTENLPDGGHLWKAAALSVSRLGKKNPIADTGRRGGMSSQRVDTGNKGSVLGPSNPQGKEQNWFFVRRSH